MGMMQWGVKKLKNKKIKKINKYKYKYKYKIPDMYQ